MKTIMLAVVAAVLATGADKPAQPVGPFKFAVVNGKMTVTGKDFQAVADRAEVDTDKGTVTLDGRAGDPAAITRSGSRAGEPTVIRARRIVMHYLTDEFLADGVQSIR